MAKANVVKIEHLEVKKRDIDFLKKAFNLRGNAEAIKAAIDSIAGNLEIKSFFERNKGIKIKRVYD